MRRKNAIFSSKFCFFTHADRPLTGNGIIEAGGESDIQLLDSAHVPIVHNASILRAITSFRKLRVQNMFAEDTMTDVVDLGINQSDFQVKFNKLSDRMECMEDKLDAILKKIR